LKTQELQNVSSTKRRSNWINILNVCACLSVIFLHCNGIFWTFPSGRLWYTSNFIETFFYWPVPIFFMVAGATLLDYRDKYSTKVFFQKRIARAMVPFLFWSLFSVLYRYNISRWKQEPIIDVLIGIFNSKYCSVYWFYIPLFAIYISIPFLALVTKELKIKAYFYAAVMAFALNSSLPLLFDLLKLKYNPSIRIPIAEGYVIYVFIGYLIANINIHPKYRALIYLLAIMGWATHFWGTSILSLSAGKVITTFKGYVKAPTVLHATGIMVACKNIDWEKLIGNRGMAIFNNLSKYTLGIYCTHYYLIMYCPKRFDIEIRSIYWRGLGPFIIFSLCLSLSVLIGKIPFVKKVIGL